MVECIYIYYTYLCVYTNNTDLPLCLDELDENTIKQEGVKGVVTARGKYEDESQSNT